MHTRLAEQLINYARSDAPGEPKAPDPIDGKKPIRRSYL
jgi:hypothetical protein